MSEPILVTGAPGNVGSDVVAGLLARGCTVRVAARDLSKARKGLGDAPAYVRFDFEDPSTYATALDGVKRLFLVRPPHLAQVESQINPFVHAARAAGVEHVVFLSVMGAERMGFLPHAKIEKAILATGLAYTFLRPSFFCQNLATTYTRMIRETGDLALPVGGARMSWIDARDIGEAAAIALTDRAHWHKAYALTEKAYDFDQVAAIFTRELGRPIRYSRPSVSRYRRLMRSLGAPAGVINLTAMMYIMARLGLSADVTPDLEQILGRKPLSMADFVRDYAPVWAP